VPLLIKLSCDDAGLAGEGRGVGLSSTWGVGILRKLGILAVAVVVAVVMLGLPAMPAGADGECGPGAEPAAGVHPGVITTSAPHWYDASSTTNRFYTVRGLSPTALSMVVFQSDGGSTCVPNGGAFSQFVEADFSLPPGQWLIRLSTIGTMPAAYLLVGN
jgi:hypothetical protein